MMTFEPKCVVWKRQGAEHVQKQIEGFTLAAELEFWCKQTKDLKIIQQKAREQVSDLRLED